MVHIYQVLTFTRASIIVVAPNSTEKDNILKKCNIEGITVKEVIKADTIIVSKEYI